MRNSILLASFFLFSFISFAQKDNAADQIPVLIRCDDIGMCHSVNMAAEKVLKTGITCVYVCYDSMPLVCRSSGFAEKLSKRFYRYTPGA